MAVLRGNVNNAQNWLFCLLFRALVMVEVTENPKKRLKLF